MRKTTTVDGSHRDTATIPSAGKRYRKSYIPLARITSCLLSIIRPKSLLAAAEQTLLHPRDAHGHVPRQRIQLNTAATGG